MAEITRQDLTAIPARPSPEASITDVKHLSSYNWLEAPTPTIAVPGCPALWSPPSEPRPLKKDSGMVYIAQNAARHPTSPLEPLFRALRLTVPSFDLGSVDIVTDRNNIRKLLSFVNPRFSKNGLEEFTIAMEANHGTVIFARQEAETQEFIGPNDFRGFGHEFEKAYTSNRINRSTGHHRITSYRFGGLRFVIRYEADGYVDSQATTSSGEPENDGLASMLASMSLSSSAAPKVIKPLGSKLTIQEEGQIVPPDSTLEIKTRVFHKPLDFQEVAPQLWVSQTTNLVRAYHRHGMFQKPNVEPVGEIITGWEKENHDDLMKLAALIHKIHSKAIELGESTVLKYDRLRDKIVISKATSRKMLPNELYEHWTDKFEPEQSPTKATSNKTVTSLKDSSVPFLDEISIARDRGYRHIFRSIPCNMQDYQVICNSLDTINVQVATRSQLRDVISKLKNGDDGYDPEERAAIKGLKAQARDAAFKLLYLMLTVDPVALAKDRPVIFNAVSYILSHRRKFKNKTRTMVRMAFEAKLDVTYKQRVALDKWPLDGDSEGTTDDEWSPDEYYLSSDGYDS